MVGRSACRTTRGFTLIELLVVLALLGALLAIALPRYHGSIARAKEAVLKENLHRLREAISQHHADRGSYPPSLEALAAARYLRAIPPDPLTGSAASWQAIHADSSATQGVQDVRSGAPGRALDGSDYASW